MWRRLAALGIAVGILGACAGDKPPSYFAPPSPKPLQVAPRDMAVVYLLRAPHDPATLTLNIEGHSNFKLPSASYVAVMLRPGSYKLTGTQNSMWGQAEPAFAPVTFRIEAGQRTFMYTSGVTSTGPELIGSVGGIPLFGPSNLHPVTGSRKWTECSELDAQGFMSISTEIFLPPS